MSSPSSQRALSRLMLLGAVGFALVAVSAPEQLDPKVAMPILLKVLSYDNAFDGRGTGDFTVLVVSEPGQAVLREELLTRLREIKLDKVKTRRLRFAAAEFSDPSSLRTRVEAVRPDALLAVPGLADTSVNTVSSVARERKLYSLALDGGMVQHGLAVAVVAQDGKPRILINLSAAKAEGASFAGSVLKLATLIE